VKHEDQEYVIIFEVCVEKNANRRERILREFFNFRSEKLVMVVMARVSVFIPHANHNANPLFHVLIMISEY
jgi:hypothetical protein